MFLHFLLRLLGFNSSKSYERFLIRKLQYVFFNLANVFSDLQSFNPLKRLEFLDLESFFFQGTTAIGEKGEKGIDGVIHIHT